jgi:hypothetical protein
MSEPWTAQRIIKFLGLHSKYTEAASFLADAINAALAAERERHGDEMTAVQLQLNKQLAEERENTQAAIAEGKKRIVAEHRRSEESQIETQQLREQLAAEHSHMLIRERLWQEKSRQKDDTLFAAVGEKAKLQEQLDAAIGAKQ